MFDVFKAINFVSEWNHALPFVTKNNFLETTVVRGKLSLTIYKNKSTFAEAEKICSKNNQELLVVTSLQIKSDLTSSTIASNSQANSSWEEKIWIKTLERDTSQQNPYLFIIETNQVLNTRNQTFVSTSFEEASLNEKHIFACHQGDLANFVV